MDEQTTRQRIQAFEDYCREQGVPFTLQRRVVLEAALELDNHPTADQIHEAVARRYPGIARTTVYRTLETLVRNGLLTKACHPGRGVRYDGRTDVHHHLICLRCDEVIDIADRKLDALSIPDTSEHGFEVSDYRVQIRGICRRCREEEER